MRIPREAPFLSSTSRKAWLAEEEWIGTHAKRFSLRGGFDEYIVAQIPARDLSDEIRRRGVAGMNEKEKSEALARYVASRLVHSEIPNVAALQH
jgi:hypothetical protein